MRAECEGGAAAWLLGTLAVPSAQDMDCLHHKSFGAIRVFFQASCCCRSEPLFGQSFSVALQVQESFLAWGPSVFRRVRHTKGPPLPGVLLCRWVHQALKGAPWVGSYSVVQCIRRLSGQPLYCSATNAGVWGESGYGDDSTPLC